MSEHVQSLGSDQLRGIRADMSSMKGDMKEMGAEMTVMRQDIAGMISVQAIHHRELASVKVRLDRIERRLELID